MQCEYDNCENEVVSVEGKVAGKYCSPKCKQAAYRTRNTQPVTDQPVTDNSDDPMINGYLLSEYADMDSDMSDCCRRYQGTIQVPGDRGYIGVCKQDQQGNWNAS